MRPHMRIRIPLTFYRLASLHVVGVRLIVGTAPSSQLDEWEKETILVCCWLYYYYYHGMILPTPIIICSTHPTAIILYPLPPGCHPLSDSSQFVCCVLTPPAPPPRRYTPFCCCRYNKLRPCKTSRRRFISPHTHCIRRRRQLLLPVAATAV